MLDNLKFKSTGTVQYPKLEGTTGTGTISVIPYPYHRIQKQSGCLLCCTLNCHYHKMEPPLGLQASVEHRCDSRNKAIAFDRSCVNAMYAQVATCLSGLPASWMASADCHCKSWQITYYIAMKRVGAMKRRRRRNGSQAQSPKAAPRISASAQSRAAKNTRSGAY